MLLKWVLVFSLHESSVGASVIGLVAENIYVSQAFCRKSAWRDIKTEGNHSFIFMTARQHHSLKMWMYFSWSDISKTFWLLYFTDILWHATCIFGLYYSCNSFIIPTGFTAFRQILCLTLCLAVFYYLL